MKQGKRGVIFVPQHTLSRDWAERLNREAGEDIAAVWYGTEQEDPEASGEQMCRYLETADLFLKAGGKMSSFCKGCEFNPKKDQTSGVVCGYQRQRRTDRPVWILPSNMLEKPGPGAVVPKSPDGSKTHPDFVVIDESPWLGLLGGFSGGAAELDIVKLLEARTFPAREGESREGLALDSERILDAIHQAIAAHEEAGRIQRALVTGSRISTEDALEMAGREMRLKEELPVDGPTCRPVGKAQALELLGDVLKVNSVVVRRRRFWALLGAFLAGEGAEAPGLKLTAPGESRRVQMRWRKDIHDDWVLSSPVLYLDGTMNARLARAWLPRLEVGPRIKVEPVAGAVTRRQVTDWNGSARKLIKSEQAANNRSRLARIVEVRAASFQGMGPGGVDVLVIGQKELINRLRDEHGEKLGPRVEFAWYNNIRGVDRWRDVPYLLMVGRPLPSPRDVAEMAGVILGRVIPPAAEDGWYPTEPRGLRMAEGRAGVRHPHHPDPDAEAVRWQICEAELHQAEARAR
ncbi:MAG TPA: hypothetical protein VEI97_19200, partial [bacterium]|nr:hypothetical protein [bacterium]